MIASELNQLLPADFSSESRIWIYQSSRPFVEQEVQQIDEQLHHFYSQWLAHGAPVKGWAKVIFRQFIVVMADETGTHVSGCSTDGMVRIIKSIERQYEVNMFDRLLLTFLVKNKSEMLPLSQVQYAIDKGYIDAETPLFNNTITTKQELLNNWLVPLKDSWLAQKINLQHV